MPGGGHPTSRCHPSVWILFGKELVIARTERGALLFTYCDTMNAPSNFRAQIQPPILNEEFLTNVCLSWKRIENKTIRCGHSREMIFYAIHPLFWTGCAWFAIAYRWNLIGWPIIGELSSKKPCTWQANAVFTSKTIGSVVLKIFWKLTPNHMNCIRTRWLRGLAMSG